MEFYESSSARPEPLRIRKRPNPNSCQDSTTEIYKGRSSKPLFTAIGSPSRDSGQTLTIHKRRKNRASVLDVWPAQNENVPWSPGSTSVHSNLENKMQPTRFLPLGACYPSDIYNSGGSIDPGHLIFPSIVECSNRSVECSSYSDDTSSTFNPFIQPNVLMVKSQQSPLRKTSLVRRTLNKMGSLRAKSQDVLRSDISKLSSGRRWSYELPAQELLSLSENLAHGSRSSSTSSTATQQRYSDESYTTRRSSDNDAPSLRSLPFVSVRSDISNWITSPIIKITLESNSVSINDTATIWVAIEILAEVHPVSHSTGIPEEQLRGPTSSSTETFNGTYGYLYDIEVDVKAGFDCSLEVVNMPKLFCMHAGQSHLLLAKVGFKGTSLSLPYENSLSDSDRLFLELEQSIINSISEFLKVSLSYKHSGFLEQSNSKLPGLNCQSTTLLTEARAIIRRHYTCDAPGNVSETGHHLIIDLIRNYHDTETADELILMLLESKRLVNSPEETSQQELSPWMSSLDSAADDFWEKGVQSLNIECRQLSYANAERESLSLEPLIEEQEPSETDWLSQYPFRSALSGYRDNDDPAHQLWKHMRQTSRGSIHEQTTFEDDHYASPEDCSMAGIEDETRGIRETALKNQRSVGADSLRSMTSPNGSKRAFWGIGGSWW